MILNIEKDEIDYYESDYIGIDMRILVDSNTKFLYCFNDYFTIPKELINKGNIYYYKETYYYLPIDILNENELGTLLEQSNIVYKNTEIILNDGIRVC